jgi:hypothetical protein
MSSSYLCDLCSDQMTTHMTTAWHRRETAVCEDCLAPPVGDLAWDGLAQCLVAGTRDEAQDWLRRAALPGATFVKHVSAPSHLRGLRRPRVYLHGTYRQLPLWPEIAQALRNVQADVIAADRDELRGHG